MRRRKIFTFLVMWIKIDVIIGKFIGRIDISVNIRSFAGRMEIGVSIKGFARWIGVIVWISGILQGVLKFSCDLEFGPYGESTNFPKALVFWASLVYTCLSSVITLHFTCGERKICSIIRKSQNILSMIVGDVVLKIS